MEEANTRQLVSRARKHIADGRRTPVNSGEHRRLLEAFIAAAQKGHMAGLENLFSEDLVSCSDGVGLVRSPRVPVSGASVWRRSLPPSLPHFWKAWSLPESRQMDRRPFAAPRWRSFWARGHYWCLCIEHQWAESWDQASSPQLSKSDQRLGEAAAQSTSGEPSGMPLRTHPWVHSWIHTLL